MGVLSLYLHSSGFLSVAADTLFFRVEPAYFFGHSGRRVKPFYSDRIRLDFRSLYVRGSVGAVSFRVGRLLPPDTGDLLLDALSTGYDALSLSWAGDGWEYRTTFMKVGLWTSDGDYYFNPDAVSITEGQRVDRYAILRTFRYGRLSFTEATVLSTLYGRFPDVRAFNPLLPGYLYQWFYAKEVNILWEVSYDFGGDVLRVVIDDFPYLPSWFSIVPPTVGVRLSGEHGPVSYDLLWVSAFTYANRRPWDALYEAPYFGGDYAGATLRFSPTLRKISPILEVGVWAKGRYNGTFKEPEIGEYPPFAFLHSPIRYDAWLSAGLRYGDLEVQVGYGGKPNSLGVGRLFLYFSKM